MSVKGTVLVAEDDPKTAELVRLYLAAAGFAVRLAADGASALAAARDGSADLVVLDWMLPIRPRRSPWRRKFVDGFRADSGPATRGLPALSAISRTPAGKAARRAFAIRIPS